MSLDNLYASFFSPSDVVLGGAASVSELVIVAHDESVDAKRLELGEHEFWSSFLHHVVVEVEELNAVYASCVEQLLTFSVGSKQFWNVVGAGDVLGVAVHGDDHRLLLLFVCELEYLLYETLVAEVYSVKISYCCYIHGFYLSQTESNLSISVMMGRLLLSSCISMLPRCLRKFLNVLCKF